MIRTALTPARDPAAAGRAKHHARLRMQVINSVIPSIDRTRDHATCDPCAPLSLCAECRAMFEEVSRA